MQSKTFTSGRIRRADYDESTRQLDLHWDDKTVRAYKHVPQEVFRRRAARPTRQRTGKTALRRSIQRARR